MFSLLLTSTPRPVKTLFNVCDPRLVIVNAEYSWFAETSHHLGQSFEICTQTVELNSPYGPFPCLVEHRCAFFSEYGGEIQ